MNSEAKKARDAAWLVFAGVAVAALVVMVLAFLGLRFLIAAEGWATFAEVYGALVGSFFAAMAFAGVILTVHLQRVEMRAARQEMARAAEAQEATEKATAAQARTMRLSAEASAMASLLATDGRRFQMPDGEWVTTGIPEWDVRDIRNRSKRILAELDAERLESQELLELPLSG